MFLVVNDNLQYLTDFLTLDDREKAKEFETSTKAERYASTAAMVYNEEIGVVKIDENMGDLLLVIFGPDGKEVNG